MLAAEGFDVVIPRAQGCCGALSGHAGRADEAKRFARSVIEVFERAAPDAVIVNSAGCGSAMKQFEHLLRDDADYGRRADRFSSIVRDVAEFIADAGSRAERHPLPVTVAYHDACHLSHAQGWQPRKLLREIPGVGAARDHRRRYLLRLGGRLQLAAA